MAESFAKKEKEKKTKEEKDADKAERKSKRDDKGVQNDERIDKRAVKTRKNDDGKEADASTRGKVSGGDKSIGKDDKGRTIYQGPRGGQYYINSNGNKTYLDADKKLN